MAATSSSAESKYEPLLSSCSRGWKGIVVELHHFRGVDRMVPMPHHVVGIHLAGSVNLLQSRNGRTRVKLVRAGDVTITPRGEPKRFQHAGDNVVVLLKLDPEFLQQVAEVECEIDPGRYEVQEVFGSPDPQLFALGKQLVNNLGIEGEAGVTRAEALATQLAVHLLRRYGAASISALKPIPKLSPRNLQRALDYIDANLREDISLAGVARALSMSPGHFAHAFKESTGSAPHRFVIARRIELAKSLLRDTDLPITQIAHQIGCASHSHFSVIFLRMTGRTPRSFRSAT